MNNFHGFFPSGYLRKGIFAHQPEVQKIITEIDALIGATQFDLETYQRICERQQQASSKISKLWDDALKKGKGILNPYIEEMDAAQKEQDAMIAPFFKKLLEMGYSEKELRQ
ncbi:MAG: hypothetical protein V1725_04550 [archaeon]